MIHKVHLITLSLLYRTEVQGNTFNENPTVKAIRGRGWGEGTCYSSLIDNRLIFQRNMCPRDSICSSDVLPPHKSSSNRNAENGASDRTVAAVIRARVWEDSRGRCHEARDA